jgi:membrane protein implicated in regulation of membrane protease activity
MDFTVRREGVPVVRDESCIGRLGILTVGTRGPAGPGEALVRIRGGAETYLAWSDTPLPKGTTVLIIESHGARTVDVIEWDAPSDEIADGAG